VDREAAVLVIHLLMMGVLLSLLLLPVGLRKAPPVALVRSLCAMKATRATVLVVAEALAVRGIMLGNPLAIRHRRIDRAVDTVALVYQPAALVKPVLF
jgi:hypothetical protein